IVGSGAYREVLEGLVHAIASGNEALLDALVAKGNDLDDTHLEGPWEAVAAYLSAPGNRRTVLSAGRRFAEHVHFTGRMSHDLLCHLFPCADVAVFPSVIPEAYPLVLMESLSNGVLPAASDFSGFAEGLDHLVPELGRELVQSMRLPIDPATCVAGMVERLSSLLAQPRDDARKARLRDIAVRRYDWKIRAREMAAAYDDLRREDPTSAD
ncbi:MAG: glycosyltransferase, partial [Planctomycetota bacterium]